MYNKVLLATALQQWDQYSAHALAAREVAAALARNATELHVLSVYQHQPPRMSGGVSAELMVRLREQDIDQTDELMKQKLAEYIEPLVKEGFPVSTILRVGSARHVIVDVAGEIGADLLVIGSHSKRGLFDIALGGTARHVSTHAPCTVVMACPKK